LTFAAPFDISALAMPRAVKKRQRGDTHRRLGALLRRFATARLLVIGDLMLDQFIWGRVDRISPEAPVPVVRVTHESFHLGGAANVAHNILALGGQATACGVIGRDRAGRRILTELKRAGAGTTGVTVSREVVTVRKTRIIAHSQQVVRFDHEGGDHAAGAAAAIARFLRRHLWDFDAVVLSDYGKGVITKDLLDILRGLRAARPFRLVVDPKKRNFPYYRGITLATPNLSEAADAAGVDIHDGASLHRAGQRLLEKWDAEAILITRGEQGLTLCTRDAPIQHFPTAARQVFDVTGAGDTVVAACALSLAVGATLAEAACLANHAAGVVVGKVGTATVSAQELRAATMNDE
jgi:rfaE bifunctional protein kinase chain/domain